LRRGDIWLADHPAPRGRRPVLLVARNSAYEQRDLVIVAFVTTRSRGLPAEVPLGASEGIERQSVANLEVLDTIPKAWLIRHVGALPPDRIPELDAALRYALGIED
jgi:mRNA interferase MazF